MLDRLTANNRAWAARKLDADPDFFRRQAAGQSPKLLWIGCADSRIPAEMLVGLEPGEVFVHRNIANLVPAGDACAGAVLQFAVAELAVEHIVVVGHLGCGGVAAALQGGGDGPLGEWLAPLTALAGRHAEALARLEPEDRPERLAELNVRAQVAAIAANPYVRAAWSAGRPLAAHGWIYDPGVGLLRDVGVSAFGPPPG